MGRAGGAPRHPWQRQANRPRTEGERAIGVWAPPRVGRRTRSKGVSTGHCRADCVDGHSAVFFWGGSLELATKFASVHHAAGRRVPAAIAHRRFGAGRCRQCPAGSSRIGERESSTRRDNAGCGKEKVNGCALPPPQRDEVRDDGAGPCTVNQPHTPRTDVYSDVNCGLSRDIRSNTPSHVLHRA